MSEQQPMPWAVGVVVPLPQASHRNDPPSSHMAEREVTQSGARQRLLDLVLGAVRARPGWTAAELTLWLNRTTAGNLTRIDVARRLYDLKVMQQVRRGGMRKCQVANRQCAIWWPDAPEPTP